MRKRIHRYKLCATYVPPAIDVSIQVISLAMSDGRAGQTNRKAGQTNRRAAQTNRRAAQANRRAAPRHRLQLANITSGFVKN
jgi:hypothetical protein